MTSETVRKPLPLHLLQRIAFDFARSKNRSKFWKSDQPRAAAIGLLLKNLMEFRSQAAAQPSNDFELVNAQDLLSAIESLSEKDKATVSLSQSKLSLILRGSPVAGTDPFINEVGARMIRKILLGRSTRSRRKGELYDVAERIVFFFFPTYEKTNDRAQPFAWRRHAGFFDPQFQRHDEPVRTCEAIEEIYAITYATDPNAFSMKMTNGEGLIVRTSGYQRFVQVSSDLATLTSSGYATLEAIQHGVHVWFFYPDAEDSNKPTEAMTSARVFEKIARKQLGIKRTREHLTLRPLPLSHCVQVNNKTYWAGDFLSRVLRFVYHRCDPPAELGDSWANLLMSRSPTYGPCVWKPTGYEIKEFAAWFNAMKP